MTTDRKLAWAALLVGIIALLPLFKENNWQWTLLLTLAVLAVGTYLVYTEWRFTRSAFTTLTIRKKVVIRDIHGTDSSLVRTQMIRANYNFVSEIWFRNMVTDGNFGPFKIDGEDPARTTRMGCLVSHSKIFNPPLSRGAVREVKLECDVKDSFPDHVEGLLHEVAQDTRCLILEVNLPAGRICKTAQVLLEAAGEPAKRLEDPEISDDRRTLTSTIKRPMTGFTYHLSWTW
jgi:hypothetical protein